MGFFFDHSTGNPPLVVRAVPRDLRSTVAVQLLADNVAPVPPEVAYGSGDWRVEDGWFQSRPGEALSFTYRGPTSSVVGVRWQPSQQGGDVELVVNGETKLVRSTLGSGPIGHADVRLDQGIRPALYGLVLVSAALLVVPLRAAGTSIGRAWRTQRATLGFTVLAALTMGVVAYAALPMDEPAVLTYEAAVRSLPVSEGEPAEVWVRLRRADGSTEAMLPNATQEGFVAQGDWAVAVLPGSRLEWRGLASPGTFLEFRRYAYSGTVELQRNDEEARRLDLRADSTDTALVRSGMGDISVGGRLSLSAVLFAKILALALIAYACLATLTLRERRLVPPPPWALGAAIVLTWSALLFVLWPGMLTPDSMASWTESLGRLSDGHPYPYTAYIQVMRLLFSTPAAVLAIQLGAVAACVVVAASMVHSPAARWTATVCAGLLALHLPMALMTVTLWKDALYGAAVVALALATWPLVRPRERRVQRPAAFALLAGLCLVVALTRHNGAPVVVATLVLVALFARGARRQVGAVGLGVLAVVLVVRIPLAATLDVTTISGAPIYFQRIANHVNAGTRLEDDERALLSKIRPLDRPWPYGCHSIDVSDDAQLGVDPAVYEPYESELGKLAVELAVRNPRAELAHLGCSTEIIWRISAPTVAHVVEQTYLVDWTNRGSSIDYVAIAPDADEPRQDPASPRLVAQLYGFVADIPEWLYRPAIYLYALLAAAVATCLRARTARPLLLLVPVLAHTAALAPVTVAQHVRYQYPVVLGAFVLIPVLVEAARRPRVPTERASSTHPTPVTAPASEPVMSHG